MYVWLQNPFDNCNGFVIEKSDVYGILVTIICNALIKLCFCGEIIVN